MFSDSVRFCLYSKENEQSTILYYVLRDDGCEMFMDHHGDSLVYDMDSDDMGLLKSHRIGHPAIIWIYGTQKNKRIEWKVNGYSYSTTTTYCEACGFDEETTLMWVLKYGPKLPNSIHVDDII